MEMRDELALTFFRELRDSKRPTSPHMLVAPQEVLYQQIANDVVAAYALADLFIKTKEAYDAKRIEPKPAPTPDAH